ncbi:hypothetical protein [Cohnella algarum]|uniref:hypothetical protein n=1 Tax=Cohnella algarum TaxID=2044859 RepID=UPI0019671A7D|nr:hypothetical protein [Cohnella algarum]MBN2982589.1 hypothetical protein [Cohnella algarum]
MLAKLLEVLICLALGFFTGIGLSPDGMDLQESGTPILLGCIMWLLIFSHVKSRK